MALEAFSKKFLDAASTWYKRALAVELNKSGLHYEDLLITEETPVVTEALNLQSDDVLNGRYRRLKRASDLSFKGKSYMAYKPEHIIMTPYKFDLRDDIIKIEQRNAEHDILDLYKK